MRIKWRGVNEFERWLGKTPGVTDKRMAAALFRQGEKIMAVSKGRTPVDTGDLRSTGHVKPPTKRAGKHLVVLAYGTDYAVYVHEITSNAHPTGQAKFLEQSVRDAAGEFTANLKREILDQIGKGVNL